MSLTRARGEAANGNKFGAVCTWEDAVRIDLGACPGFA